MELNPGFDGKVTGADGKGTPKIENGVVTEFGFRHGQRDRYFAGAGVGGIEDSELFWQHCQARASCPTCRRCKGCRLTNLHCSDTQVSDLSPLQGMPLTRLGIAATRRCPTCRRCEMHCKSLMTLDNAPKTPKSPPPLSPPCKKPCPTARSNGTIRRRLGDLLSRNQPWNTPAFQAWVKATASPACREADRSRQQEADGIESGV